jgi:peptide/nickel transport system substrate-binding protein
MRLGLAITLALLAATPATASFRETPMLVARVEKGTLPPVAERLPKTPLVVDLAGRGRTIGRPGGRLVSLIGRARDIRYLSAVGYARLVGYDEKLKLGPDLLLAVEEEDERVFTFTLREGHKWSDGKPFTTEDFRYWFEDIASNKELSPAGLPDFMLVEGAAPRFEILDERRLRLGWDKPNPRLLPALAHPRDPFIYRPAHYLKRFHIRYADKAALEAEPRSRSCGPGRPCITASTTCSTGRTSTSRPCNPGWS